MLNTKKSAHKLLGTINVIVYRSTLGQFYELVGYRPKRKERNSALHDKGFIIIDPEDHTYWLPVDDNDSAAAFIYEHSKPIYPYRSGFNVALPLLLNGEKVKRLDWGEGKFLVCVEDGKVKAKLDKELTKRIEGGICSERLILMVAGDSFEVYHIEQTELLAEDWTVVLD